MKCSSRWEGPEQKNRLDLLSSFLLPPLRYPYWMSLLVKALVLYFTADLSFSPSFWNSAWLYEEPVSWGCPPPFHDTRFDVIRISLFLLPFRSGLPSWDLSAFGMPISRIKHEADIVENTCFIGCWLWLWEHQGHIKEKSTNFRKLILRTCWWKLAFCVALWAPSHCFRWTYHGRERDVWIFNPVSSVYCQCFAVLWDIWGVCVLIKSGFVRLTSLLLLANTEILI